MDQLRLFNDLTQKYVIRYLEIESVLFLDNGLMTAHGNGDAGEFLGACKYNCLSPRHIVLFILHSFAKQFLNKKAGKNLFVLANKKFFVNVLFEKFRFLVLPQNLAFFLILSLLVKNMSR